MTRRFWILIFYALSIMVVATGAKRLTRPTPFALERIEKVEAPLALPNSAVPAGGVTIEKVDRVPADTHDFNETGR